MEISIIGSTEGIYSDHSLPLTDHTTRLLMDTLAVIDDEFLDVVLTDNLHFVSSVYSLKNFLLHQNGENLREVRNEQFSRKS